MKKIIFVILIAFLPVCVLAETIELKDGQEIEGKIISETEEVFVVEREEGTIVHSISKENVRAVKESIEAPAPVEKAKTKTLWQKALGYVKKATNRPAEKKLEKKTEEGRERQKAYRLEQYNKEVRAAKKARKAKESRSSKRKCQPRFRDFRSSSRCGK